MLVIVSSSSPVSLCSENRGLSADTNQNVSSRSPAVHFIHRSVYTTSKMRTTATKQFILALACCNYAAAAFLSSSAVPPAAALHLPSCMDVASSRTTELQLAANEEGESGSESESTSAGGSSTNSSMKKASSSLIDNDEYVSPNQIKELRKEVAKRRARRKLTQFKMPQEESYGEFKEETLAAICGLLAKNELVEVRGISRDRKREVFATTEELGMALSEQGKFVSLVETKGFAATFYCPGEDDEVTGKKIVRRTSYKENQWAKKPKPKRDNRGQIIKGEYEYFD